MSPTREELTDAAEADEADAIRARVKELEAQAKRDVETINHVTRERLEAIARAERAEADRAEHEKEITRLRADLSEARKVIMALVNVAPRAATTLIHTPT
jgi:uncharacterized coiled-coil DUF342 family protein